MTKSKNPALFEVNDKIEIALQEHHTYYMTMVQETDKDFITIGLPMLNARGLLLREEEEIKVKKVEESAIYVFLGRVISRLKNDNVPLYKIEVSSEYERIQRRNYVRISIVLPLKYRLEQEKRDFISTKTVDISGGGLMFVSDTDLLPNEILDLKLRLFGKDLEAKGKVIRTYKFLDSKANVQKVRVCAEFAQIREQDREKIISFIFKKIRNSLI